MRLKTIASAVGLLQKSVTHTQGQMQVQPEEVRVVSVSGIKAQFRVPPADMIMADGMHFCKLKTNSFTLINLIFENNADAPAHDSGITLTYCNGLSNMVQLRNDAQAQQLASARGSTLFEANDEEMKKKRQAMSRFELKEKRKEHTPISIDITVDDEPHTIEVLRSVNAKNAL